MRTKGKSTCRAGVGPGSIPSITLFPCLEGLMGHYLVIRLLCLPMLSDVDSPVTRKGCTESKKKCVFPSTKFQWQGTICPGFLGPFYLGIWTRSSNARTHVQSDEFNLNQSWQRASFASGKSKTGVFSYGSNLIEEAVHLIGRAVWNGGCSCFDLLFSSCFLFGLGGLWLRERRFQ